MHDKTIRRRRAVLALLVAISLILLTDYFGENANSPLHSVQRGIVAVLTPIQDVASKVLSPVRNVADSVSTMVHANSENGKYKSANERLTNEVAQLSYYRTEYNRESALLKLDNTANLGADGLRSANVIGQDPSVWYKTITVDKGSGAGVNVGDPVIGGGGLVGEVSGVTADSANVSLITSPGFAVGAMVEDAGLDHGILKPAVGSEGTLVLSQLPPSSQATQSEEVVTSGFSDPGNAKVASLFPPDIPIGTVSNQSAPTTVQTGQYVDVTPYVDLTQLTIVQIVTRPKL